MGVAPQNKYLFCRTNTNIRKHSFTVTMAKLGDRLPELGTNAPSMYSFEYRLGKRCRHLNHYSAQLDLRLFRV